MATVKNETKKNAFATDASNVGLSADRINTMQSSLTNYINAVVKKIQIGANTKNIQAAIKGSNSEAEVRKYIQEIDTACSKFLQDLAKYNNKLTEMANAYKANDKFTR